jgi:hemolysin III
MQRTKLADRVLPNYSIGEERMNMITHIVGGGFGVVALTVCLLISILKQDIWSITGSAIYGVSLILLYTMSSVYHGLKPGMGKKVLQVIDHCTIYLLIAGTYTPILLIAFRPVYPAIGWGLFVMEWTLAILATTLNAIDLKKYSVLSMVFYIGLGWAILPFIPQTIELLGIAGFGFLLAGGISYTIGAVLFGIGSRVRWMHSVFHIFVVLGSILQFVAIYLYVL